MDSSTLNGAEGEKRRKAKKQNLRGGQALLASQNNSCAQRTQNRFSFPLCAAE
jgi:hypothetical protein